MVYNYSLLNDKILAWSKFKEFANDKLDVVKMMISLFDQLEITAEKEENTGCQHCLLFPQCFPKPTSLGLLKVELNAGISLKNATKHCG